MVPKTTPKAILSFIPQKYFFLHKSIRIALPTMILTCFCMEKKKLSHSMPFLTLAQKRPMKAKEKSLHHLKWYNYSTKFSFFGRDRDLIF
jgi:hypothetical protein